MITDALTWSETSALQRRTAETAAIIVHLCQSCLPIRQVLRNVPSGCFSCTLSIVPRECDAFFLGVNWNRPKDSSQWYLDAPMGVNRLSNIMSRMARRAGLAGKFTNHSVRRTMCNELFQRGVKSDLIAQLSGHKNVGGFAPYTIASGCQQQGMSLMLQHANVTREALAVITGNPGPQCQQGTLPSITDSQIAIPGPSHVRNQSSACVPSETASRPDSEHVSHVVNIVSAQHGSAESLRGLMGLFSSATFNAPVTVTIQMNEN